MRLLPICCQCSCSCPAKLILQPLHLKLWSRPGRHHVPVAISHSMPRHRLLRYVVPACRFSCSRDGAAPAAQQLLASCQLSPAHCRRHTYVMMMLGRQMQHAERGHC